MEVVMFSLLQATDPAEFAGIYKMVAEGGAFVLLAFIVIFLIKKLPAMAKDIATSHEVAVAKVTESQSKNVETITAAHKDAVKAFTDDARDARSVYRQEQEAARAQTASLIRDERASCEARSARIEGKMDEHAKVLSTMNNALTQLLERDRRPNGG